MVAFNKWLKVLMNIDRDIISNRLPLKVYKKISIDSIINLHNKLCRMLIVNKQIINDFNEEEEEDVDEEDRTFDNEDNSIMHDHFIRHQINSISKIIFIYQQHSVLVSFFVLSSNRTDFLFLGNPNYFNGNNKRPYPQNNNNYYHQPPRQPWGNHKRPRFDSVNSYNHQQQQPSSNNRIDYRYVANQNMYQQQQQFP